MEEYPGESVLDLVENGDLDVRVSCAIIVFTSLGSFVEIREMIKEYLKHKKGERFIHGTAASVRLFIVKEDDYELLQQVKKERKHY